MVTHNRILVSLGYHGCGATGGRKHFAVTAAASRCAAVTSREAARVRGEHLPAILAEHQAAASACEALPEGPGFLVRSICGISQRLHRRYYAHTAETPHSPRHPPAECHRAPAPWAGSLITGDSLAHAEAARYHPPALGRLNRLRATKDRVNGGWIAPAC